MKSLTKRKMVRLGALVLALLLVLASQGAAARPAAQQEEPTVVESSGILAPSSTLISYQGTLTDPDGIPVSTAVTMEFHLYDAASGGAVKWGPETQSVTVTDGLFNVLLGSVTAIVPANLTGDLWLDIKVNGEQLTPRERLTTVPYAVEAGTLAAGATTRGWLYVNGSLQAIAPDNSIYSISLKRTDEGNRVHKWNFWHMNEEYGMNSLQIYEYRTDSTGQDCAGNQADGAICAPRLKVAQGGNVGIGTTDTAHARVTIDDYAVPLAFRENDQSGAGSLWRMPLDDKELRFDVSQNGTDFVSGYITPLTLYPNGAVGCGALTENNLQTPKEREAGGSDRFEEGDLLCWGIDQLEKCAKPNDRLVQAVADSAGRPIVIGAEAVKVLGPVRRGDILVASSVPGYAMVNNDPVSGSVIAQALEDFDEERGVIKAMIRKF